MKCKQINEIRNNLLAQSTVAPHANASPQNKPRGKKNHFEQLVISNCASIALQVGVQLLREKKRE